MKSQWMCALAQWDLFSFEEKYSCFLKPEYDRFVLKWDNSSKAVGISQISR